jgi:YesN/AraC family two-component response regulator
LKKNKLTRKQFEKYMQNARPYLKSDLKITDLVSDLQINRTYISSFINSEYGMNFSNYINTLRLMSLTGYANIHQQKIKAQLSFLKWPVLAVIAVTVGY